MNTPNSRTAEFARLFDLFERLASLRPRTRSGESSTNATDDIHMPVPPELAPVVHSLATIVGTRKHRVNEQRSPFGGRPRSKTLAAPRVPGSEIDESDDEESLAKFPVGKQYPFTFKMMLHKLYELEEWANKVKEVLERSQIQYKPLAERDQGIEDVEVAVKSDGHVRFRPGVARAGNKKGSPPLARPRSHSVATPLAKGRDSLAHAVQQPRTKGANQRDDVRALKKRCVGRRKSMSEPIGEVGRMGGGWVYDAAISSVGTALDVRAGRPRSGERTLDDEGENMRGTACRGDSEAALGPWSEPEVPGAKDFAKRRRRVLSVASANLLDETQRKRMKRPFSS